MQPTTSDAPVQVRGFREWVVRHYGRLSQIFVALGWLALAIMLLQPQPWPPRFPLLVLLAIPIESVVAMLLRARHPQISTALDLATIAIWLSFVAY